MSSALNEVIIYKSDDGNATISVRVEDETVWLTIDQMSDLFIKSRSTINEHILNIFKEKELLEEDAVRKIGNSDFSTKPTNFYNLDVIISVGYRVKSVQGTRFRQWATRRLNELMSNPGFMEPRMNTGKHRLKSIRDCLCLSVVKKVLELK